MFHSRHVWFEHKCSNCKKMYLTHNYFSACELCHDCRKKKVEEEWLAKANTVVTHSLKFGLYFWMFVAGLAFGLLITHMF
jgi:hypothetical protein